MRFFLYIFMMELFMGNNGPEHPVRPVRRKRLPWGTVVFVFLTAGGIAAALYLRGGSAGENRPPLQVRLPNPAPAPDGPFDDGQFDLTKASQASGREMGGLTPLENLPPDLDFPPGSERISLVQMQVSGLTQTQAEYVYPGRAEQAESLLRERLGQLGWREVNKEKTITSDVKLTYYKSERTLSVILRPREAGVRIVAVIVEETPAAAQPN